MQSTTPRTRVTTAATAHGAARLACIAALALAACQDSVGPAQDEAFETARARGDYAALESVLNGAAVTSFESMSARLSTSASAGANVPGLIGVAAAARPGAPASAGLLLRELQSLDAALPLISPASRGATFVWSAESGDYRKDPTRAGAPANGVRFILYATDPATGQPDPTRERGHADLTDTGSANGPDVALRLVAVYEGITFLNYGLTLVPQAHRGRLDVRGFVRDPEHRVDFEVAVEGSRDGAVGRVDVAFTIGIAARAFRIDGRVRGVENGAGRGEIELTVRHGEHSIRTVVVGDERTIDASFAINGTIFATARGDRANPVIRRPDGSPLSAGEIEALAHIVRLTETILEWVNCLVEPVGGLVALGIVL